jgi:hypothetical protein
MEAGGAAACGDVLAPHFPSSPRDNPRSSTPSLPFFSVKTNEWPVWTGLFLCCCRHQFTEVIPSKQTNRMHNLVSVVTRKRAPNATARLGFPRHPLYIRSFCCLLAVTFHHVNRLERSESKPSSKISTPDRARWVMPTLLTLSRGAEPAG